MDELTAQTSIIINCCSSYKLTELLLRSCMKTKTHFLDFVPDRQFLANISHYHREAKKLNLYLLMGCSWESVSKPGESNRTITCFAGLWRGGHHRTMALCYRRDTRRRLGGNAWGPRLSTRGWNIPKLSNETSSRRCNSRPTNTSF